MSDRYFSDERITGDAVTLAGPEAHHLRIVMRAEPGQRVVLFDGSGCEFVCEVSTVKRAAVALRVVERLEVDRELPCELVLGVALPKGERQRWLVEKAVEIGVTRLVPLETERGVAEATRGALERLRRGVIEATKQCGRTRLMQVGEPTDVGAFAYEAPADAQRWLADPDGAPLTSHGPAASPETTAPQAVWLAIGPEGGFTPAEVAAVRNAGWQTVSLGPRILRVETAAIVLAGVAAQGLV